MRFKGLDLNLLVALDVLLAECSVSRAAERLHLSQPSVSAALARLREYFDDPLLQQHGKRMIATPRALELQPMLATVLADIDGKLLQSRRFDPATADRWFSLCLSDYLVTVLGPQLVATLQREAPGVKLDLQPPSEAAAAATRARQPRPADRAAGALPARSSERAPVRRTPRRRRLRRQPAAGAPPLAGRIPFGRSRRGGHRRHPARLLCGKPAAGTPARTSHRDPRGLVHASAGPAAGHESDLRDARAARAHAGHAAAAGLAAAAFRTACDGRKGAIPPRPCPGSRLALADRATPCGRGDLAHQRLLSPGIDAFVFPAGGDVVSLRHGI